MIMFRIKGGKKKYKPKKVSFADYFWRSALQKKYFQANCFIIVYSDLLKDIDKEVIKLETKKRPMLKLRKKKKGKR